jgi:hypothetical protein
MIQAHGLERVGFIAALTGIAELQITLWLLIANHSAVPLILTATALVGLLIRCRDNHAFDAQGSIQPSHIKRCRARFVRSGLVTATQRDLYYLQPLDVVFRWNRCQQSNWIVEKFA